ncbi:hypothetical protein B2H94_06595 [Clostridium sporogenes]|uniref:VCBS repeat-containing protein n=3 Tax=Clostridiaceae TaxID=31979 RepID=A0ABD6RW50_CLOSG|nr:hypothetical protein [Clostridium sporogenes]EDU37148.1 hypothetical protein CLOSPO_03317 [Clostridium sporogenes ATCC 15579]MCW6091970.1 hypothetical protein [Clostridium sporogenes]MCW6092066.1 hypothetical protein [Clostridium sporogenes]NFE68346.1 hypothetical protein [Clostridium sporogenes]NFL76398.1 hypothetical protein [Clostridium sporogenes]
MFFRIPEEINGTKDKIYILDTKCADVNGDGFDEIITVTGKKPYGENGFIEDITLNVKNKKTNVDISIKPKENAGYEPNLFIGKFGEDNIPKVFLSINSGGSGGYYFNYIYSFKDNIARLIFDYEKFSKDNEYTVVYEDYYKARVKSLKGNLEGIIDLTAIRDKEYLSQIYNENGKLKEPIKAEVLFLSNLSPLSLNGSDSFNLLTHQRIIGLYNADTLGSVESILKWDGYQFYPIVTQLVVLM